MVRKNWDIQDWKSRCSELAFEVERLWKEVEEWKQQNQSLLKDRERLEWMAKGGRVINKIDNRYHKGYIVEWDFEWDGYKKETDVHSDWRAAIDEAMKDD